MSHSEFAIAGFYDHEQEFEPRAPDWGGDAVFSPAVAGGRRTVTITGRPQVPHVARRPARTIDDRIAHRPERVAAWSCAMGFLMIALAVLTSH
jgi:hypothetical protein